MMGSAALPASHRMRCGDGGTANRVEVRSIGLQRKRRTDVEWTGDGQYMSCRRCRRLTHFSLICSYAMADGSKAKQY